MRERHIKPAKIINEEKIDELKEWLFFLCTVFIDLEWTFFLVGFFLTLTLARDILLVFFLNKLSKRLGSYVSFIVYEVAKQVLNT